MYTKTSIILVVLGLFFISFKADNNEITFSYPKKKDVAFKMNTDKFNKFKGEWRGEDYYYLKNGKDGFICSVLFYKLNESEIKDLDKLQRQSEVPKFSPVFPAVHFSSTSNTKDYESNEKQWGDPDGDFMFSQVDIKEYSGQKINQKNMFAYAMFGDDIYLKVHLSKVLCTPQDSTIMRNILESLEKIK